MARPAKPLEYGLTGFFALLMLGGAVAHVVAPEFYAPMIPPQIPPAFANIAATIVEGAIGILLLLPRTRALGFMAFCALMIAFLPLHVWDLFKDKPMVGSFGAAIVRLIIQFVLIGASAWMGRALRRRATA